MSGPIEGYKALLGVRSMTPDWQPSNESPSHEAKRNLLKEIGISLEGKSLFDGA